LDKKQQAHKLATTTTTDSESTNGPTGGGTHTTQQQHHQWFFFSPGRVNDYGPSGQETNLQTTYNGHLFWHNCTNGVSKGKQLQHHHHQFNDQHCQCKYNHLHTKHHQRKQKTTPKKQKQNNKLRFATGNLGQDAYFEGCAAQIVLHVYSGRGMFFSPPNFPMIVVDTFGNSMFLFQVAQFASSGVCS
jgi:hypothetical protein